ncbi:hypothetical protein KEM60_02098 [Austwickia sp. TVS 96-490-7B]|nr:hypothetical protein [Austwickia sp. TVS 96-490-7B]
MVLALLAEYGLLLRQIVWIHLGTSFQTAISDGTWWSFDSTSDDLLVEPVNGHDIDATVPGFGRMQLKSPVVKKF